MKKGTWSQGTRSQGTQPQGMPSQGTPPQGTQPQGSRPLEQETALGILPVMPEERRYGFWDAALILSGYCIATWSYTQGAYLATLVGFRQLLAGAFAGAIFMLLIYQLPVVLSVRYGIDIWIWLRAVFGSRGVKVMTLVIIAVNFPWYAVCGEMFASSMENLAGIAGVPVPIEAHRLLALLCVAVGSLIALKGLGPITWSTRLLVPALLAVGVIVAAVAFTQVPFSVIWDYVPKRPRYDDPLIAYVVSVEANFAFVITLVGGMAEVPRLARTERGGYLAGVVGQGISGSFFVVLGAVMAIATEYATGAMSEDPSVMMAALKVPSLAYTSLLLVAFANIGTQAVGSYLYGVMLKSTFRRVRYGCLVGVLGLYVGALCLWGGILEYFGAFLTLGACVYGPLAGLLFTDFFLVRKGRLAFRSAYGVKGHEAYRYTGGFQLVGFLCLAAGMCASLFVYDPVGGVVHRPLLFMLTPTGLSFLTAGLLYWFLSSLAPVRRYMRKDLAERPDTKPFDRFRRPPRQNAFAMPFLWLGCWVMMKRAGLVIRKRGMKGLKPPFLVLGTHHSFTDFYVTPLALFPHRANYVSELEGFEAFGEWYYRQAGCLGTRKFVDDFALIQNIRWVMKRRGILVLYPEARYANVGTSSVLPESVAKLVKVLKVPVVTLNMKGNYLRSPIWNARLRREVRLEAELSLAVSGDEAARLSVREIGERLEAYLTYDEYAWQREKKMAVTVPWRAEGLHMPLYQCRCCRTAFQMRSQGNKLFCRSCGAVWAMDEYGTLELERRGLDGKNVEGKNAEGKNVEGKTVENQNQEGQNQENVKPKGSGERIYIPDWYEWERENVIQEIREGRYSLDCPVRVEALPNAVNFIDCGKGRLVHGRDGFALTFTHYQDGKTRTIHFPSISMTSIHTEYNYRGKGQCVVLSVPDDSYFLFPLEENGFNATRIQFAVEELYALAKREKSKGVSDTSGWVK